MVITINGQDIEARVIQKIATEAEWAESTILPRKGEFMIVGDSNSTPINIKVGNGVDMYPALPYMFDSIQQNVNYYPVSTLDLPTPVGSNAFSIVVEGEYTFNGSPAFTVPIGNLGVIYWDGSVWALEQTIELPTSVSNGVIELGNLDPTSGDTVFKGTIKPIDLGQESISNQIADITNRTSIGGYVGTTANQGMISTVLSDWRGLLVPLLNGQSEYHVQGWGSSTKTVAFYKGAVPDVGTFPIGDNSNLIVSDRSSNLPTYFTNATSDTDFTKPEDATYAVFTIKNGNLDENTVFENFMVSAGFGDKTKDDYQPLVINSIKGSDLAAKYILDSEGEVLPIEQFLKESDLSITTAINKFTTVSPNGYINVNTGSGLNTGADWAYTVIPVPEDESVGAIVLQDWNTITKTIGFYDGDVVPLETDHILFSGRITDYTGDYTDNGNNIKVTYPVGTKNIVVTIKRSVDPVTIYEDLLIAFSTEYIDNTGEDVQGVDAIKTYPIIASYVRKNGLLVSTDDLMISSDSVQSGDVIVSKIGNDLAIRIPFDDTQDAVHRWNLVNANGVYNSMGVYVLNKDDSNNLMHTGGEVIHNFSDNIAPIFFKLLSTATGNHGVALPLATVTGGHGKTASDLFSTWASGADEYYLVEIVSTTQLRFIGKVRADGTMNRVLNSNTITHVSGAVNTGTITATSRTATEIKPAINAGGITHDIFIDNTKIEGDGIYYGDTVRLVEVSNVPDWREPTLVAPFDVTVAPTMIQQRITYSYDTTNTLYIDYVFDNIRNFPLAYMGFLQSGVFSVNSNLGTTKNEIYFPNSNVYGANDFRQLVDLTTPLGTDVLINNSDNEDIAKPVQRAIQISSDGIAPKYGYAHGYAYNIGRSSVSERAGLFRQWELRGSSGKSYPRVLWEFEPNFDILHVSAYCQYFDPKKNPDATSVYVHKEEGVYMVYMDFHESNTKALVNLPEYVHNKSFEVVDSIGVTVLAGNNIPSTGLNVSVSPVNGYAYAVLKTI